MIPEYVARHWWERILYNQSARRLRTVLLGRPNTVVVDVPVPPRRPDPVRDGRRRDRRRDGRTSATAGGPASPTRAGPAEPGARG